ncbi:MAG: hypothetical protein ABJD68_17320 [Nakamurella sp.]
MDTLNGLPAHILLVHAIVVLLPLAAFLLVLIAVWPAARRHLALANAVLSVVVVVLVPVTTNAGEWLEKHIDRTSLVEDHAELGDTALFVAVPVAILAILIWWRGREITAVQAAALEMAGGAGTVADELSDAAVATIVRPNRRTFLAPESVVVTVVIVVLSVLAAGAAIYDTYRIGDSGAKATWQGEISTTTTADNPAGDGN